MDPQCGIQACPVEILWKIFLDLRPDYRSLLNCRAVCRRFCETIDGSVEVQLALRLDAWGYEVPEGPEREPLSGVLTKLNAHVEAWRTLNWEETRIRIPRGAEYACDLAHGVFVSLDISGEEFTITCVSLPSRLTGSSVMVWRLPTFRAASESLGHDCLAVDPSQDLLIIHMCPGGDIYSSETFIHFRNLSDGSTHPSSGGSISIPAWSPYWPNFQIFEYLVGFVWSSGPNELSFDVWNWKTGQLIWRLHRVHDQFTYCIISLDVVLISYEDPQAHAFGIQAYAFSSTCLSGRLMSTFALHAFTPSERLWRLYIKGGKAPPRTPPAPFQSLEEKCMMQLVCGPIAYQRSSLAHDIFIPASLFTEDFGYPPATPIPYFVWSAGRATLLQGKRRRGWMPASGSSGRFAYLHAPSTLRVYDFNIPRCGRNRADPSDTVALVRPQAAGPDSDRSCSLPYWSVSKEFSEYEFNGTKGIIKMDEEHIVLVNRHARETNELVILTF